MPMSDPQLLMVNDLSAKEAERLVSNGVALGIVKGYVALLGLGAVVWGFWQLGTTFLGWIFGAH